MQVIQRCTILLRIFLPLLLLILLESCGSARVAEPAHQEVREITVLYTNDEHGWMEGTTAGQGAARLYRLWREQEGFSPEGPFLLLSGGDNWTGPAISTWVEGRSMVEVMNAMSYDASAVGNHEFDFGLEVLASRVSEAEFPYLSANTRWRDSGRVPEELGILPFTVTEVNGLQVAIIGLTTTSTPGTTNPRHVERLQFDDYEQVLRATVPQARASDPDLLLVIAHVCMGELEPLAQRVADLHIDLMGGGHCNELVARQLGSTVLLGGGYHFTAYARARFLVDATSGQLLDRQFGVNDNSPGVPDPAIAARVKRWQEQFGDTLSESVGWSDEVVDEGSAGFRQAVIDSWLRWDPTADIAITNVGGLRAPLPAGEITLNDLVNVMPFENTIIAVDIPGAVVRDALAYGGRPIVAGLVRRGEDWVLAKSGEVLQDTQRYRVLINSFMYDGGDNYQVIREADPQGFDTGIHYRQPFVDWLTDLQTSPDNPLRIR